MSLIYGGSLTLGGTINIGSYENIKVELSGAIRDEADLEGLVVTLQTALERIGREDPQVRTAIDSFARRVLGSGESSSPGSPERTQIFPGVDTAAGQAPPEIQGPHGNPCDREACEDYEDCDKKPEYCPKLGKDTNPAPERVGRTAPNEVDSNVGLGRYGSAASRGTPQTSKTAQPSNAPEKVAEPPQAKVSHVPPPKASAAKQAAPHTGTCEVCGTGITAAQIQKAMLFRSSALCRSCMDDQPIPDERTEALRAAGRKYRDEQDAHAAKAAEASRA